MDLFGNIHSIETCGTVDGPGVRFVVFFQGCPLRCAYCHNPDSWKQDINQIMSVDEIYKKYSGVKEFAKGGITATGGEPLLQIDFLIELFKFFKSKGVHTALDTSGALFDYNKKFDELIKYTDLVLLDIKSMNPMLHKKLTGYENTAVLNFAKYLSENNVPLWIRSVIIKGLTNKKEDLIELGKFMASLKTLKALDILPYHNMAIPKYEALGIKYKLKEIPPTTEEEAKIARDIILKAYNENKL